MIKINGYSIMLDNCCMDMCVPTQTMCTHAIIVAKATSGYGSMLYCFHLYKFWLHKILLHMLWLHKLLIVLTFDYISSGCIVSSIVSC